MVEKNLQSELGRFLNNHTHLFDNTFTFEVKLCKNKDKRFDFALVKVHQKAGLLQAVSGYYYKDSDAFLINGQQKERRRCDAFFIKTPDNYVAIGFWIPRKHKTVYFLTLKRYLELEKDMVELGKKSCHEADIREYTEFTIDLLKREVI